MSEPVSAGAAGGDSAPATNGAAADPKANGSSSAAAGEGKSSTPAGDGSQSQGAESTAKKPLAERKQARKDALKAEQDAARKKDSTTKGGAAPSAPQAKESPPGGEAPPSAAETPKETALDGLAKVTLARRQLERDQQKLADERKAWEEGPERRELGTLKERLTKHEKVIALAEAGDIAGLVRHLGGENWRQTWFDLASGVAGDDPPPPTLSPEELKKLAREEAKAELKAAEDQKKADADKAEQTRRENMDRAITAYGQEITDMVLAAADKYPHFRARHFIGTGRDGSARFRLNRERVETILREEHTKAGKAPDPQVVLDRLEAEAREIISKTLPAVAASPSAPSAGPGKTITPAMKAGATPPTEQPRGTLKERLEARKARLRSEQQQQRR